MNRIILTKSTFSGGILQAEFKVADTYAESGVVIKHVDFYEFYDGAYGSSPLDINYVEAEYSGSTYDGGVQKPAKYTVYLDKEHNHLLKAVVHAKPEGSNLFTTMPCCATPGTDGEWLFEVFFVDMGVYERALLEGLNFKCNDCEVSNNDNDALLRLFAVKAAAESQSPMLEYFFSKTGCGKKLSRFSPSRLTKKCDCNG